MPGLRNTYKQVKIPASSQYYNLIWAQVKPLRMEQCILENQSGFTKMSFKLFCWLGVSGVSWGRGSWTEDGCVQMHRCGGKWNVLEMKRGRVGLQPGKYGVMGEEWKQVRFGRQLGTIMWTLVFHSKQFKCLPCTVAFHVFPSSRAGIAPDKRWYCFL